jgi:hypothetical protein
VGNSTVSKIFGHFLFKGGWNHPVWSWPSYHLMLLDTRNKNIYSLGWRIRYNTCPLLCPHQAPRGDDFNKLAFLLSMSENVYINLSFMGQLVLVEIF